MHSLDLATTPVPPQSFPRRGFAFLASLLLVLLTAASAGAETKQISTTEIKKAKSQYSKAIAVRDDALRQLQRTVDSTGKLLASSKDPRLSKPRAQLAALGRAIETHVKSQDGKKATSKKAEPKFGSLELAPKTYLAISKSFEDMKPSLALREMANVRQSLQKLAKAQADARTKHNSFIKIWNKTLQEAAGAEKGQPIIVAKPKEQSGRAQLARMAAGPTCTTNAHNDGPHTLVDAEFIQSCMYQSSNGNDWERCHHADLTCDGVIGAPDASEHVSIVDRLDSQPTIQQSITVVNNAILPEIQIEYIETIETVEGDTGVSISALTPTTGVRPTVGPPAIVLLLTPVAEEDEISLFEFADQVGHYDNILVDIGPDFCQQMIDEQESGVSVANPFDIRSEPTSCYRTSYDASCHVCFYEHSGYRGDSFCSDLSESYFSRYDMNDKMTSLKLTKTSCPRAGVTVTNHSDGTGWRNHYTENVSNVGSAANDEASYFSFSKTLANGIVKSNGCWVRLYEDTRYRGRNVLVDVTRTTIDDLGDFGMNDKVSSVKVEFSSCPYNAKVYLYKDKDREGLSRQIESNISNVGDDWNDKASSVRFLPGSDPLPKPTATKSSSAGSATRTQLEKSKAATSNDATKDTAKSKTSTK